MGIPVSGKHAIEVAAFVAVFQQTFHARAIEALSSLQVTLGNDFPSFQTTNTLELRVEEGVQTAPIVGSASGVLLQNLQSDGKLRWALRAEGNAIVVQCFDYDRWVSTSNDALRFLQTAINLVVDAENPLTVAALQTVDRFIAANGNSYDIGNVFNKRSPFLSKHSLTAGPLWHVYQGWFENESEPTSCFLNVLNLSTNNTPSGLVTTIDHNVQFQSQVISAENSVDANWLRSTFNALHQKNKFVIEHLLNAKQKRAIKL